MMREIFKANWKLFVSALFGLLAGAALGGTVEQRRLTPAEPETTEVDRIGLVSILPETKLHFTYQFTGCMHTLKRDADAMPYVGETREEFQEEYPDGRMNAFSSETVEVDFLRIGACPAHVMLKADDAGQLRILKANAETLEVESVQVLPLFAAAFDAETAEELYEGIAFDSADEINEYLENAES